MQIVSHNSEQQKSTGVLFTAAQLKSSQLIANSQKSTAIQRQLAVLEQGIQEAMSLPPDASISDRIEIGKKAAQKMQQEGQRAVHENAEEYLDKIKEYIEEQAKEAQNQNSENKNTEKDQNTIQENGTEQAADSKTETSAEPVQPQTDTAKKTEENSTQTKSAKFTKQIDIVV